jgi:EAL domain-containing protein (putative c-di-GMP-specific phosphodiesterase class I)
MGVEAGSANQASPAGDSECPVADERKLTPLGDNLSELGDRLGKDGAVGLILIDVSPLLEIERLYGARPYRSTLEGLASRIQTRLTQEIGDDFRIVSGTLEDEHIMIFVPRSRADAGFYSHELPLLAQELRAYVAVCLKGIIYPYLYSAPDLPVGSGIGFNRPFNRIESQIRRLVDTTLRTAHFELERANRERAATLERILLEERVHSVFEPIVQLEGMKITGYEALSRGPTGTGLESPMNLFSIAERCGFEFELDNLCRRQALRNAGGIRSDQKLFLNILPSSIHDPDFAGARVREMLGELGLAPRNLVLEISERQAIANYPIFREAIDHFSRLGFEIALDDTGAGFSSLEAALELNPRYLKIDMSLVRGIEGNPQKQEALRGLRSLSEKMSSTVIAEGIETRSELEAIQDLGIEYGQGFIFGRGGQVQAGEIASTD